MNDPDEARAALAAVTAAQARLAERSNWSLLRHAAAGALMALLLFAQSLGETAMIAVYAVAAVLALLVAERDRRRDGMFVNGWRIDRTLWVTVPLLAFMITMVVLVRRVIPAPQTASPLFWVLILLTALVVTGASMLWQRIYRNELRRGASADPRA